MTMNHRNAAPRKGKGPRRTTRSLVVVLALGLGLLGCESLLEVDAPGRVSFDTLMDPANAQLLLGSARANFECAFGSYVVAGGLLANELEDSQLAAALWSYDRRSWSPAGGQYATGDCNGGTVSGHGVYQPLQTGVLMGDTAVVILSGFTDAEVSNRNELIATASVYAGYSVLLLGEAMCEAPLRGGPSLTSNQLFAEAEARFNQALSSSPSANVQNFARVGLARARLNAGNTAGALTAAQAVPAGFQWNATYATTGLRESNRVERSNIFSRWVSVDPLFQNLTVEADGTLSQGGTTPDPRVPTTNTGALAQDQTTILWTQGKYTARDQAIPIARYAEAQLIIAEIELGQTAVDIINELHTLAGLPTWTPADVNDDLEILNQVIGTRFRELYLESHQYYSLRRYHALAQTLGVTPADLNPIVPYLPAPGAPFKHGGVYGDQPCLPLPDAERLNNPNIP
jgi:starch-binding outer membrane protein, SusD/RagB family